MSYSKRRGLSRSDQVRGVSRFPGFIPSDEDRGTYCSERGKQPTRSFGNGRRSFGQVHFRIDPSEYITPKNDLNENHDSNCLKKFKKELEDLEKTKKGCIVWYILEYLENCDKVVPLVDTLILKCLFGKYVMEVTTKNFLLISNINKYGEIIKTVLFNSLKHIHEDLMYYWGADESMHNPQLFLAYYNTDLAIQFYKFVGLLYFRFRKHLDSYKRYKSLAAPTLAGIEYLLERRDIQSLELAIRLIQLNLLSITRWYDVSRIVDRLKFLWEILRGPRDKNKWTLVCGMLDIIDHGPILPLTLYKRYEKMLGSRWTENVVYPPVQVLEQMNKYLIAEKAECFHIDDYDVFRNMFVYLP